MVEKMSDKSMKAAKQAAAKVNAILVTSGHLEPSELSKTKAKGTKTSDLFTEEVCINDAPMSARNFLTRSSTQEEIRKMSGAAVSTRGRYMAGGEDPVSTERPLYLHIQGVKQQDVKVAVGRIMHIILEHKQRKNQGSSRGRNRQNNNNNNNNNNSNLMNRLGPRVPRNPQDSGPRQSNPRVISPVGTRISYNGANEQNVQEPQPMMIREKVFIPVDLGLDPNEIKNRILGENSQNLRYIQEETGVSISLRGNTSSLIPSGQEGQETLHFFLEHADQEKFNEAKDLVVNLAQTVLSDLQQVVAQVQVQAPPPQQPLFEHPPPQQIPINTSAVPPPQTLQVAHSQGATPVAHPPPIYIQHTGPPPQVVPSQIVPAPVAAPVGVPLGPPPGVPPMVTAPVAGQLLPPGANQHIEPHIGVQTSLIPAPQPSHIPEQQHQQHITVVPPPPINTLPAQINPQQVAAVSTALVITPQVVQVPPVVSQTVTELIQTSGTTHLPAQPVAEIQAHITQPVTELLQTNTQAQPVTELLQTSGGHAHLVQINPATQPPPSQQLVQTSSGPQIVQLPPGTRIIDTPEGPRLVAIQTTASLPVVHVTQQPPPPPVPAPEPQVVAPIVANPLQEHQQAGIPLVTSMPTNGVVSPSSSIINSQVSLANTTHSEVTYTQSLQEPRIQPSVVPPLSGQVSISEPSRPPSNSSTPPLEGQQRFNYRHGKQPVVSSNVDDAASHSVNTSQSSDINLNSDKTKNLDTDRINVESSLDNQAVISDQARFPETNVTTAASTYKQPPASSSDAHWSQVGPPKVEAGQQQYDPYAATVAEDTQADARKPEPGKLHYSAPPSELHQTQYPHSVPPPYSTPITDASQYSRPPQYPTPVGPPSTPVTDASQYARPPQYPTPAPVSSQYSQPAQYPTPVTQYATSAPASHYHTTPPTTLYSTTVPTTNYPTPASTPYSAPTSTTQYPAPPPTTQYSVPAPTPTTQYPAPAPTPYPAPGTPTSQYPPPNGALTDAIHYSHPGPYQSQMVATSSPTPLPVAVPAPDPTHYTQPQSYPPPPVPVPTSTPQYHLSNTDATQYSQPPQYPTPATATAPPPDANQYSGHYQPPPPPTAEVPPYSHSAQYQAPASTPYPPTSEQYQPPPTPVSAPFPPPTPVSSPYPAQVSGAYPVPSSAYSTYSTPVSEPYQTTATVPVSSHYQPSPPVSTVSVDQYSHLSQYPTSTSAPSGAPPPAPSDPTQYPQYGWEHYAPPPTSSEAPSTTVYAAPKPDPSPNDPNFAVSTVGYATESYTDVGPNYITTTTKPAELTLSRSTDTRVAEVGITQEIAASLQMPPPPPPPLTQPPLTSRGYDNNEMSDPSNKRHRSISQQDERHSKHQRTDNEGRPSENTKWQPNNAGGWEERPDNEHKISQNRGNESSYSSGYNPTSVWTSTSDNQSQSYSSTSRSEDWEKSQSSSSYKYANQSYRGSARSESWDSNKERNRNRHYGRGNRDRRY